MESDDVAKEARKIFARYKMLGYGLDILHTLKTSDTKRMKYVGKTECEDEVKIPIPFKLLGISDALEENFNLIAPQNLFDGNKKPNREEWGGTKPCIGRIQCINDKFANLYLNEYDDFCICA